MKKIIYFITICLFSSGLMAQTATPPSGDGTELNPYQIATLENLYWLSERHQNENDGLFFIQTANIDASETSTWDSGAGLSPIAIQNSNYDGQGYYISGLYINRPTKLGCGVFESIPDGCVVSNLGIVDCSIVGQTYVGGLAGQLSNAEIKNCYTTGSVTGNFGVGGMIGRSYNSTVTDSYSQAEVHSTQSNVGGFVGLAETTSIFENCNSQGTVYLVDGGQTAGGFVGNFKSGSQMTNCYSVSFLSLGSSFTNVGGLAGYIWGVIPVTNCFWDMDASGQTTSNIGSGKTTAEMKLQSTYTGWDFTDTWAMQPDFNDGYPFLQWQPVPTVTPMPISDWAIYIGILLISGFMVISFRKRLIA